jgi:hypothetical protein
MRRSGPSKLALDNTVGQSLFCRRSDEVAWLLLLLRVRVVSAWVHLGEPRRDILAPTDARGAHACIKARGTMPIQQRLRRRRRREMGGVHPLHTVATKFLTTSLPVTEGATLVRAEEKAAKCTTHGEKKKRKGRSKNKTKEHY